ncbi:MAG: sigma-54 dependent transcriptional regulator [Acidobacteria bacterium]|nr:sigma-54 dependent transcriptional regulator [Acidobacteriota bacterium]
MYPDLNKNSRTSVDDFVSATLRLLNAAIDRELLFQELMAVLQQYFAVSQIIIFRRGNAGKLTPLHFCFCSKEEAATIGEAFSVDKFESSDRSGKDYIFHRFMDRDEQIAIWLPMKQVLQERSLIDLLFRLVELILAANLRPASQMVTAPGVTSENLGLIYQSAVMRDVVSQIRMLSGNKSNVLIVGESGTGKELVARAIHQCSPRADQPFITYNCSSIPREIAESELFGHRKGAFTGAHLDFPGIIRSAEGGSLFLDEIGDLPLEVQPKLLRFLEHGEIQPLGASKVIRTDIRVITATNRDLSRMVSAGQFRADLWYRLNFITIALPPLRERREDIPLLAEHLLGRISAREGKSDIKLAPEVIEKLMQYDWPGNVRELANEIERLVVFTPSHKEITIEKLSPVIKGYKGSFNFENGNGMRIELPPKGTELAAAMAAYEEMVIHEALRCNDGNLTKAAGDLGISRQWLGQLLKARDCNRNKRRGGKDPYHQW